jgi:hypothetical protein
MLTTLTDTATHHTRMVIIRLMDFTAAITAIRIGVEAAAITAIEDMAVMAIAEDMDTAAATVIAEIMVIAAAVLPEDMAGEAVDLAAMPAVAVAADAVNQLKRGLAGWAR